MDPIIVKHDIPLTFNIIHESKLYPLSLLITIRLKRPDEYEIQLVVPLPSDYKHTNFKKSTNLVSQLSILYHVIKKEMYIESFFVHDKMNIYKKLISMNETFNTKGLGKYMLCTVVQYLLENTDWFDINSIVTLKAYGGECFYKELFKTYPFERCLEELKKDELLFDFFINNLSTGTLLVRLDKSKLQHYNNNLNDYYEDNKEEVNTIIEDMVRHSPKPDLTLRLLQRYLCEIRTNDDLIKKNYNKIYGFHVVKNYGLYSSLIGNVYSLLSACLSPRDLVMYKAIHASKRAYENKKHNLKVGDEVRDDEWTQGRKRGFKTHKKVKSKQLKKCKK